jgi:hypothetical protein
MPALLIGTVLALAGLAFVIYPVLTGEAVVLRPRPADDTQGETAVAALREIEFDRATGKLSDTDYSALKETYTSRALAELRATSDATADAAEAVVRAYRARHATCTAHGARPESDAVYCSECGRYLAGACATCGASVTELGARYCAGCGTSLAA